MNGIAAIIGIAWIIFAMITYWAAQSYLKQREGEHLGYGRISVVSFDGGLDGLELPHGTYVVVRLVDPGTTVKSGTVQINYTKPKKPRTQRPERKTQ